MGDTKTKRSTSGFIIYCCGGPICCGTRKQPIVALSTTEAECIATPECKRIIIF